YTRKERKSGAIRRVAARPTYSLRAGRTMSNSKNRSNEPSLESSSLPSLANLMERSQLDFELEFFSAILEKAPTFADALRIHGSNLTLSGKFEEGMAVDKRLVQLRPQDY